MRYKAQCAHLQSTTYKMDRYIDSAALGIYMYTQLTQILFKNDCHWDNAKCNG